jgi:MFS family permease
MDAAAGLSFMATPLTLKTTFGLSDDRVGLVMGTCTLLYVVFSLLGGRSADRWGPKKSMALGLVLVGLNSTAYVFAWNLWLFIACAITMAVGHAFFWPSFQAWIGRDVNRRETARRVGIFSVGWSLGLSAFGPLVGGWALEIDIRLPFALAACIAFTILLFFQIAKPQLIRHGLDPEMDADGCIPATTRRKFLTVARLANLVAVVAIVTMRTYFPLVCLDWHLSESTIGKVLAVLGISQSSTFFVLSLTHRWHYQYVYLFIGQILGMGGLLIFGVSGAFLLLGADGSHATIGVALAIPALLTAGMLSGIAFFSSSFYSLYGEAAKGKNTGIHESIIGAANVIAQYGGAAAVNRINQMAPYWMTGLLIGGSIAAQFSFLRTGSEKKPE